MAQLIDIGLVTLAIGAAIWTVIKYFADLGRVPKNGQAIGCSGCNITCHAPIPANSSTELIRSFKSLSQ